LNEFGVLLGNKRKREAMNWQLHGYILSLVTCSLVCTAIGLYTWRRRDRAGLMWLAIMMWAVAIWTFSYGMELASADLSAITWWLRIEYVGIVAIPVTWLCFVSEYTGYWPRLKWTTLALLSIVPAVTLLLHWTNHLHHLYYSHIQVSSAAGFPLAALTRGPAYWAFIAYTHLMFAAGLALMVRFWLNARGLYRTQASAIVAGAAVPWLTNMVYLVGLRPFQYLDLTPLAFNITVAVTAWGIFRAHFLDIVPVAREKVMENIGEAILVLDKKSRLLDINPAGARLLGLSNGQAIGRPLDQLLDYWSELLRHIKAGEANIQITSPDGQQTFDLRIFPLRDEHGEIEGQLVVLLDITEHIRAEQAMRQAKDAAEASNRAKSAFLSNLSHEFRTPLNIILGFGQLMVNDDNLTPRQREGLEMINSSGEQLLGLVNGLLEMLKNEAAQLDRQVQEVDRLFAEHAAQSFSGVAANLTSPTEEEKTAISLMKVPPNLLARLEEAAIRLDMESVNQLIERISDHSFMGATALTALARDFKYGEIVALCHQTNRRLAEEKERR